MDLELGLNIKITLDGRFLKLDWELNIDWDFWISIENFKYSLVVNEKKSPDWDS